MTIGHIGHGWRLSPRDIDARAGLPRPVEGHRFTLREIAAERGVPVAEIVALVERTVAAMQAEAAK